MGAKPVGLGPSWTRYEFANSCETSASTARSRWWYNWTTAAFTLQLALLNFADWDDGASEPCSLTLKRKGFRDILDDIKVKVPEHRIKLNSVVTKISYSGECLQSNHWRSFLHWKSEIPSADGVILSLNNGEEHHYDHVIVTCSLGYLKKNLKQFFCPALDARKEEAISSLGMFMLKAKEEFVIYEKKLPIGTWNQFFLSARFYGVPNLVLIKVGSLALSTDVLAR